MFIVLYIDSAFLHNIMDVLETIPVAGATTNPSFPCREVAPGVYLPAAMMLCTTPSLLALSEIQKEHSTVLKKL